MKTQVWRILCTTGLLLALMAPSAMAVGERAGQSGMTFLAISLGARESAMGDASVALARGAQGLFHNAAVIADVDQFSFAINQVNWLVDTKLYGIGAAYSLGQYGAVGLDLVYMDYGKIVGTRRVDRSVNSRGFEFTDDIAVQDYAVGLSYAYRVSDKYAFGVKLKRVHEDLGTVAIVIDEEVDPATNETTKIREKRDWKLSKLGFDFGGIYDTGYKGLIFAMSLQNLSGDMKYWFEEFNLPLVLRMGLAMDITEFFIPDNEDFAVNLAVDALHPNDFTERIHVGSEIVYQENYAVRLGYKSNHDVESFSAGLGVRFDFAGVSGVLDYAYGSADFFKDINRFSIQFDF